MDVDKNRLIAVVCALVTHCCIGGIYAFSLFTDAISKNQGIVARTNHDWDPSRIVPILSVNYAFSGIAAALTGVWAEKRGPNVPIMLGGVFWGGGMLVAAIGLLVHSLTLLYFGYGVIAGVGIGLACKFTTKASEARMLFLRETNKL